MNEKIFYSAVASTDFSERYYALCKRFPFRAAAPCRWDERDMASLLIELGYAGSARVQDKSYTFDQPIQQATLHVGFAIQNETALVFWCWAEIHGQRIGGHFPVLAYEAARHAGHSLPTPPYPRPEFYSLDDLRAILTQCFQLSDMVSAILSEEK